MNSYSSIAQAISWVPPFLYLLSFIPQVAKNSRIRSAKGFSDMYLLGFFSAYSCFLVYLYCFNFPAGYRVMSVVQSCLMFTLLGQRLYYDGIRKSLGFSATIFGICFLHLSLVRYYLQYPVFFGSIFGWLVVFFFSVSPVTQMIHFFKTKSVKGFSVTFASLFLVGSLVEFFLAIVLQLPIQSVVLCSKNFFLYSFILFQISRYSKMSRKKKRTLQFAKQARKKKKKYALRYRTDES